MKETGDSRYVCQNQLDKFCFQHDVAYGGFKDLNRQFTDEALHDKASDVAKDPLHKPIIRKFNKRKVQSPFINNIWGADLADIQLISKFGKEFRFLLCVIDIYSKYARVIPLKDKKGITITNALKKS